MVDLLELTLISLFSLHGVCRSWLQNLLVVIVPLLKVSVKRGLCSALVGSLLELIKEM